MATWEMANIPSKTGNEPDLRRLFGFETSYEIDGFLKSHNDYHLIMEARRR
jgi:hypothetical protein